MPKCSLRNCKNITSRNLKKDGVSYFRFPRDPKRRGEWTSFVSQQRREDFFKPNKSSVVCSNHFLEEDIYVSEKGIKLLFKTAIPSVVGVSESSDADSKRARKPRTSSKKKNHEPKQSSCGRKEIKVFCSKCNAEVSHTAEGIQEDQTKALIAKVFHYFEEEFELLKKMTAKLKLLHLSKFRYRTAQATGVSEAAVLEILQEEARRKAAKRYEQPRNAVIQKEVAKTAEIYQEVPQNAGISQEPPEKRHRPLQNPSQTESSNGGLNDSANDVTQPSVLQHIKIEPENDKWIVKKEPMEYYDEQAQIDPIWTEVKVEPSNDEMDKRHIEEASSIAEAPSYYQLSEELHVTQATQDIGDIKIEINYDPSTSNSSPNIPVRVDNKNAERNRLYRERHREMINQRRRDKRLRKKELEQIHSLIQKDN